MSQLTEITSLKQLRSNFGDFITNKDYVVFQIVTLNMKVELIKEELKENG